MKYKLTIFVVMIFFSCIEDKNLHSINFEDDLTIEVKSSINNRGTLILNKHYMISSSCPLIFEDKFPDWIVQRLKPINGSNKFEPKIYDILPPYTLFKEKQTNYFYVLKNGDSLKFKM